LSRFALNFGFTTSYQHVSFILWESLWGKLDYFVIFYRLLDYFCIIIIGDWRASFFYFCHFLFPSVWSCLLFYLSFIIELQFDQRRTTVALFNVRLLHDFFTLRL
jgi:hypothetical protein